MFQNETVSVIFPTYNEKESIRAAVEDFQKTGVADEIIVVNNNAAQGTSEEVAKTTAIEIFEKKQGYGYALMAGLAAAKGNLLILAEPDGTFCGPDIKKLLAYSEDSDVVFGTRTSRFFIGSGANMGFFLKWGNYAVGKILEVLFGTTILTDVGCTMKCIRRNAYLEVRDRFRVGSSHFGPHLMLLLITSGFDFVEIPVNYRKRIGKSMVTGSFLKSVKLGLTMLAMILYARFASLFLPSSIYFRTQKEKKEIRKRNEVIRQKDCPGNL